MSTKWIVGSGLLIVAVAAFILAPAPFGKLCTMTLLRVAAPEATTGAAGTAAPAPVFIAFDQARTPGNLFYRRGSEVWEQRGRHRLLIRFSVSEPQLELDSYVTSIMYLDERMNTLSFHPFQARMRYQQAVAETEQLFRKLGLHDAVNWREYEERLDSLIVNREVYVPQIALPSALVQLYLNCRWDYDALPRGQADDTECYPIVYLTPKKDHSLPETTRAPR